MICVTGCARSGGALCLLWWQSCRWHWASARTSAIFSLINQVMLRMLPVGAPERLVVFHTEGPSREGWDSRDNDETGFSYAMYKNLRDRNQVFDGVIARSSGRAIIRITRRRSARPPSGFPGISSRC